MTYNVILDFKRAPGFAISVEATSEQDAIERAKRLAPQYGFTEPVKKAKAIAQQPTND